MKIASMEAHQRANLQGLKVISFESRRAKEMAELIRRYGGEPLSAPSMREVPLSENRAALELVPQLEAGRFDLLILLTGVGTKALHEILLGEYSQERILAALRRVPLVARGPKPVAALKELGLHTALVAPSPNTWRELLAVIDGAMDLHGKRIAVQEYGIANPELTKALSERGATVAALSIYRWALPEDLAPLREGIRKIIAGDVQVALFTNGAQVDHLLQVARGDGVEGAAKAALKQLVVASVGPVCTEVLEQFGIAADLEAAPPKMGSLIALAAERAWGVLTAKPAT